MRDLIICMHDEVLFSKEKLYSRFTLRWRMSSRPCESHCQVDRDAVPDCPDRITIKDVEDCCPLGETRQAPARPRQLHTVRVQSIRERRCNASQRQMNALHVSSPAFDSALDALVGNDRPGGVSRRSGRGASTAARCVKSGPKTGIE